MTLSTVFLIVAFICFVLATVGVPTGRWSLLAIGLAFWVLADLLGSARLVI
jgi:hypothetical protein